MNYAVILSGGIGTRMQMGNFPKQYYKVKGKMILEYTLDTFEKAEPVEAIVRIYRAAADEIIPVSGAPEDTASLILPPARS